jgi:hypothetical protein
MSGSFALLFQRACLRSVSCRRWCTTAIADRGPRACLGSRLDHHWCADGERKLRADCPIAGADDQLARSAKSNVPESGHHRGGSSCSANKSPAAIPESLRGYRRARANQLKFNSNSFDGVNLQLGAPAAGTLEPFVFEKRSVDNCIVGPSPQIGHSTRLLV